MKLKIEGEVVEVKKVFIGYYLPLLDCDNGCEYYVASDSESAGEAARKYWEDMANDDPKELACIIGEETLIKWGLNQWAGPGSTAVRNLEEWLDLWLDTPEEQWASYDGNELEVANLSLTPEEESELNRLAVEVDDDHPELAPLRERELEQDEWQELIEELGFTPTVAYRHN